MPVPSCGLRSRGCVRHLGDRVSHKGIHERPTTQPGCQGAFHGQQQRPEGVQRFGSGLGQRLPTVDRITLIRREPSIAWSNAAWRYTQGHTPCIKRAGYFMAPDLQAAQCGQADA